MDKQVRRLFAEKKPGFDVEAQGLAADLKENLGIKGLKHLRMVNRYDISGLSPAEYKMAANTIFHEPPVDFLYEETLPVAAGSRMFAVEYLPGQYDQRADWAAQCVQVLTLGEPPRVASAKVIILEGELTDAELSRIKQYCINPVEAREASLDKPATLEQDAVIPEDVAVVKGFVGMSEDVLADLAAAMGFAMSLGDLAFCQQYFRDEEQRDPSITELKVIDTYWSDHCRHTTFSTRIDQVAIEEACFNQPVKAAWENYQNARKSVYAGKDRAVTLMDIATIGMKEMRAAGLLADLDVSEEINAASIVATVDVNGKPEDWLIMFKNETHNHPTEIEPFGGAATCLGGAIRDPLSGRSYVYQAMRLTGSGDPRTPVEQTLPGKLPQRKITTGAAAGYSSYGNQIGLATGQVAELYDEGYVAKRMEIGAVIGAAPRENVVRERPQPGDAVILLGGRTGRDGCGGATGSSKEHDEHSLLNCGAEVQKGNPPTERKIQRLFRDPQVSRLIKRCNDFGAGGVSVAIGELADGLDINLDVVPKKYEGLDGTELAISESQERMAVVVAAENVSQFLAAAARENLEATVVASVTAAKRLKMTWRGQEIVNLNRCFLDTNGVQQHTDVCVKAPQAASPFAAFAGGIGSQADWLKLLQDLNVCSQQGLMERFDSTIGAGTVIMPYGGRYQNTPAEGMAAKIPLLAGETRTATAMTFGCNPGIAKWSPFHGAVYAVVEAVTKLAAMGADHRRIRLTLQEYFEKVGDDPEKWGKPFSALLGALYAQQQFQIPAIGGKDSMSGTFRDMTVPPTLAAFAVAVMDAAEVLSPEFKETGSPVVLLPVSRDACELPDFAQLNRNLEQIHQLMQNGCVLAARSVRTGGLAAAVSQMAFGNGIGLKINSAAADLAWFSPEYGALVLELKAGTDLSCFGDTPVVVLGHTQANPCLEGGALSLPLREALAAWRAPLAKVFPLHASDLDAEISGSADFRRPHRFTGKGLAKPRVIIPVFPGSNCEYDSQRAFERAGASVETLVVRNLSSRQIADSIAELAKQIQQSQIIMLPGGFSAGDEPDGSGKFIAAFFRSPQIREAVTEFLEVRDGLMLGICNGFQALIKLGLVPYGRIVDLDEDSPTLTYNRIGRHVSKYVTTRVASTLSPWFANAQVGDIHVIPVSHGEGRFVASAALREQLMQKGQIATQYVDEEGRPTASQDWNPNGSLAAVEGITSPDGRVLGKMGHSERAGVDVARNIPGNKEQGIFLAGVQYFR